MTRLEVRGPKLEVWYLEFRIWKLEHYEDSSGKLTETQKLNDHGLTRIARIDTNLA